MGMALQHGMARYMPQLLPGLSVRVTMRPVP
jgi:hypothetical protein